MVAFFNIRKLDDEGRALVFRVSEHIRKCGECYKLYDSMRIIDEYTSYMAISEQVDE
jgi:predicted anti-sigma-YlaC factor YlaD